MESRWRVKEGAWCQYEETSTSSSPYESIAHCNKYFRALNMDGASLDLTKDTLYLFGRASPARTIDLRCRNCRGAWFRLR
jgi:hypothetical protein